MAPLFSWGNYPRHPQTPHLVHWPEDVPRVMANISELGYHNALAFGCGRSYGDSCLAESDHVLAMKGMDRVVAAAWETGVILAQSGITLAELIRIALPRGWFLPVTPGTKFVTLGGAVANDVHGKNHHVMGTFGRHVKRLVMYRSDEGVVECSPSRRADLFAATIGGLGLTGIILVVELQLRRISSSEIEHRNIRFGGLDEFFEISQAYDASHEYTVAWIDCLASGKQAGRGHYIVGNHAKEGPLGLSPPGQLIMPIALPFSLVNGFSLRVFNTLYYHRQRKKEVACRVGYDPFFYPLDRLLRWNRMYGRRGFQQFQCVVPQRHGREVIRAIMQEIARSGTGSFLAVLKQCGELASPGLLSFPLHGVTLALDFPQRDQLNDRLFAKLDALVHEAGGRLYPAKDAHMSAIHFKNAYPEWNRVEALRDPQLMSRFWKRVTQ
ncbi:MAG: FAD-binding oxidoreductase [Candidatus Manganitrophus sp.]|nr:FAD-binding oxidoreductase [Candidatus Manganitrophus sp.]MDC4223265.1 FAD-binding oxidoreductase [Candidatus Manganitrophus sp.]WDT71633.1 MAG: FAD-binding oxidoreductase [Candidatus Manganitrophus sp.]WDT76117.1 MAG: FAD-binding oxidoreductase [Candidatus Manganitrophus sp.]WDT81019.1 MAG: FAD-binding oxidoreductase [Candidatus Manganitrophus sp.]